MYPDARDLGREVAVDVEHVRARLVVYTSTS
jgi:hypothetical protein